MMKECEMSRWVFMSGLMAVLALGLGGCGRKGPEGIRLYAAAGMRLAVDDLIAAFEAQTGIAVEVDYAGSGMLITRAQGDPAADLFMPAEVWYVDQLHEKTGNIEDRATVSYFVPTIIVPKGNPKGIKGIEDLTNPALLVGLGNPKACQIGRMTAKIFENAAVDIAAVNALDSLTVNELGIWVKMNNVDVSVVWDAIAVNIADSVDTIAIPKEINEISVVACGLMKTSANKPAARKFMQFMTGPAGRAILNGNGYLTEAPYGGTE
jgi:molybdate transport system substrate-binding protein